MGLKSFLLLLFFCVPWQNSSAAPASTGKKTTKKLVKKKLVKKTKSKAIAGEEMDPSMDKTSSEYARSTKFMGAGLRYGLFVGQISGPGVDIFYSYSKSFQIGFYYFMGSKELDFDDTDAIETTSTTIKAQLPALYGRYFFTNTLNMTAGIGQRMINYGFTAKDKDTGDEIDAKASVNSTSLILAVGNYWAWDNGFYAGADWIGYSVPFASSSSTTITYDGTTLTEDDLKELNEIMVDGNNALGKTPSSQLLLVNIGYMF